MAKKARTSAVKPKRSGKAAASPRARPATPRKRTSRAKTPRMTLAPQEAAIAERAYYIYLGRGASGGHDLDDWLQAERELRTS